MFSKARSLATTLIVLTIVTIAGSQSSEAQLFRRFLEGDSNSPENRQSNAQGDDRKTQDPRSTPQKSGSAPTAGRSNVDPKQNANAQPRKVQGNQGGYPPGLNGRSTKQPATQPQRPQPNPSTPATRQSPLNPQVGSGMPRPQPTRTPQLPLNPNSLRNQLPGLPKPNIKNPVDANFGATNSSAGAFNDSPLTQPKQIAEPKRSLLSKDSAKPLEPNSTSSQPDPSIAAPPPANEREVLSKFGLNLTEESESVWVTQIDARGNASQAGLQRGDKIVSLGGAPVVNPREFSEIAGLLSEGDQIELIYSRDGKENKAFVQYGTSAESSEQRTEDRSDLQLGDSSWSATPQNETQQLQQLVAQQRQVIAELQKRVRELERRSEP